MENKKIIAVVGMCGAGKSEVIEILKENGFANVYFGEATFDELKRRNLDICEQNERLVREEFRASGDMAIYAKFAEPKIVEALKHSNYVSLESLYGWTEYNYIKSKFGDAVKILSVVTNYNLRVKRLQNRPFRPLNKEKIDSRDYAQIENLEQGGPIARGDYFVINNGTKEELKEQVMNFLNALNNNEI